MIMLAILLILITAFIGVVVWVFNRKRNPRFAQDARIPFDDDDRNHRAVDPARIRKTGVP